jgi:type II secretory pathway pseudopilin PulG
MRSAPFTACLIFSIALSGAYADDTQKAKDRAKACNTQAAERQLDNEALQAFLKACLAGEGPVTAPDEPTKARDRKKNCATLATSKSLTGADRDAFMQSCLAGHPS